ncbi:TIGR03617 family F420-dependent LLM class oxidoreductase [Rhodococcus sp. NPDC059234]|uniref:TIGR03617 family F420-dependent LLM class oxidoreductase n=1 Tax=Rhodococcus sp. NPDC059234 TaxID=3346781 RepID=UPI00366AC427
MKVEIQLDAAPVDAAARAVELASTGAAGLFTFEGPHDVFFPLVAAAPVVNLDLTTNVAIALPRSPMHLAHAAHDLQVLAGGRFRLGLGSQIRPHIEKRYGATWSRPAARMREVVQAVRAIFDTWEGKGRLDFRGEFYTHTLMAPTFDPGPNPFGPPPILLGALGPVMTRTAAEVADGLLVMPFNSERHFHERTLPAVDRGLASAGRDRSDFEIVPQVIVATGRTEEQLAAATEGVRRLLAFYGSTPAYRPVLEVEGWAHLQEPLNALSKRGAVAEMVEHVDDAMVDTLAVRGTPEDCARQIRTRFGAHADRVCCYFPGYQVDLAHVRDLVTALDDPAH